MHEIEEKKKSISSKEESEILSKKLEEEVGDVFFALVNYARFLGVNAEEALRFTNNKFIKRFQFIEDKLKAKGKSVTDSNLEEMDKYWNESKNSK